MPEVLRRVASIVLVVVPWLWLWTGPGSALASPTGPVAPPPYLALPAGQEVARVEYHRYDFVELGYPNPTGKREMVHREVKGHLWIIDLKGAPKGATPAGFGSPLAAAGWEVLSSAPGGTVARYTAGGREAWFEASLAYRLKIVEIAAPVRIELTPPGATPEELVKDQDLPFFSPLPGFKLESWTRHEDGRGCEVRNEVIKGVDFAGPPSVEFRYKGTEDVAALEVQEAYVDALTRAGWDVVHTGRANNTTAHYGKQGRDVWLRFSPGQGWMGGCVADVGAAAAEARLKKALDEVGHVAVYGIYFDLDKATLRPEAESTLEQIRALLARYPALKLEIQGHTDNRGTHEHNQKLSEERAASVKAWLAAHKIDGARLATAGYAETRPVASNDTPDGQQKNRRVELARRAP